VEARCWDCAFEFRLGYGSLSPVSVAFCQVEVSVSDLSLVSRSPTERGVSECDREASIMRRTWPTGGCRAVEIYYSRIITVKLKINLVMCKEPDPTSRCEDRMKP